MPTSVGRFGRDDNGVPVTQLGMQLTNAKTLTANNTTAAVPIFAVTGTVLVNALYGVVTTALGNNTAAYWRLNDATAQSNITVNTGTSLTSAVVGALLVKKDLASAALTLLNPSQERVSEPTTLETLYFSPFLVQQKTGGVATNIEFVYTTTDTPTSGAITFYAGWVPVTQGSKLTNI